MSARTSPSGWPSWGTPPATSGASYPPTRRTSRQSWRPSAKLRPDQGHRCAHPPGAGRPDRRRLVHPRRRPRPPTHLKPLSVLAAGGPTPHVAERSGRLLPRLGVTTDRTALDTHGIVSGNNRGCPPHSRRKRGQRHSEQFVPLRYCYEPASHGRSPSRPHCRGPEGTATPLTVAAARLATSITELAIPASAPAPTWSRSRRAPSPPKRCVAPPCPCSPPAPSAPAGSSATPLPAETRRPQRRGRPPQSLPRRRRASSAPSRAVSASSPAREPGAAHA